jgi:hypothetical protein
MRALSAEVRIHLAPPVLIDQRSHAPRIARSARINCRRTARSLTGGTHHDQSDQAHVRAIIVARQPMSCGGLSHRPAHVAHYARGLSA